MNDPLNILLQPLLLPFNLINSLFAPLTENQQVGAAHLQTGQGPYSLGEAMALKENIFAPKQEPERVPQQNPNSNVDAKPPTSPYVAVLPTPATRGFMQRARENSKLVAAVGGSKNQRLDFDPTINRVVNPRKVEAFGTDKHTK